MTWLSRKRKSQRSKTELPRLSVAAPMPVLSVGRWLQRLMIGVTVMSLSISCWWWQEGRAFQEESTRLIAATARTAALIAELKAQMAAAGLTLSADEISRVRMDVAFINQLADKRAFSWTQLLSDLEATVPVSIAIGSVKVNFQESMVTINGISKDLSALNDFVSNLQKHESFRKAMLVNHHVHEDENGQGGRSALPRPRTQTGRGIEFSLAAQYRLQNGGGD